MLRQLCHLSLISVLTVLGCSVAADPQDDGADTETTAASEDASASANATTEEVTGSSSGLDASTGAAVELSVRSYTAGAADFSVQVSSHLIEGPTEAILVDGQLYAADAQAVVDMINDSGKTLTAVFLTHAHPDHFMGLDVIHQAFPDATVYTTPEVLAVYDQVAGATFDALKAQGGDAFADAIVIPTALEGSTLEVDGQVIEVLGISNGESTEAAALAVRDAGVLITGDLVFNNVHLYLAECHLDGWKQELDRLEAEGFATIYPGHGAPGDASSLFAANRDYIDTALEIFASQQPPAQPPVEGEPDPRVTASVAALQAAYPDYGSGYLLRVSVAQYYSACVQ